MDSGLLSGLNASQKLAVTSVDGPLVMLAGPGSGKTRVVTHRIAYMIEKGVTPESILALTFTNKAAEEMRARLGRLVGDTNLWMGTFHGFCVRLLRRYASLVGLPNNFSIYDTDDAELALRAAVVQADFSLTHVSLGGLANRISYYKNRLVTPDVLVAEGLSSEEHHIARVYPFYQRELLKNGAVDFDDLLLHTATILRSSPEIRAELDDRYRYVMVDEYQDTNLAQYVIVRHLCIDHPNLAVTGDPDQSIYGWRGANLKNISYMERDYPQTKIIRLEDNYRSTPEILSVADCLIQHNQFRKPKTLVPSRPSGKPVQLCVYPTARREADDIVEQIANSVSNQECQLRDFAVLYRTNAQSRLVEQALMRHHLPYQLIGGFRFYMRKEVKDLVSYLLLLHNPEDDVAFERVINTPARGVGKQSLAKLKGHARRGKFSLLEAARSAVKQHLFGKKIERGIESFLKIYDELVGLVHGSLHALVEATITLTDYRNHLLGSRSDGELDDRDVLANIHELLAEAAELDAGSGDWSALESFLEYAALQADTDRLKYSSDMVTLMTLHAAKGLEFSRVFVIALEDNILPHARSRDDAMAIEEERRLLFVGITRARDQLQLSYALRRGFGDQDSPSIPSGFLLELPRGEMTWRDLSEADWIDGHFSDHSAEDDYAQVASLWDDDISQEVEFDNSDSQIVYDEDDSISLDSDSCQLPPDELPNRIVKKFRGRVTTGAQLAKNVYKVQGDDYSALVVGRVVSHPQYGSGRIIAASGRGGKKSVTVDFFSSRERRSFIVSHVSLTIEDDV